MDAILDTLQDILIKIVIGLLGLAATYAMYYIKKAVAKIMLEADKIKDDKQRALVKEAIDRVDELAYKAVAATEQTVAAALRKAVKEGIANREELLALGAQACEEVYSQLSPAVIEALKSQVNDVDKYIADTVESMVLGIKSKPKPGDYITA
jgi:phage tail protein X